MLPNIPIAIFQSIAYYLLFAAMKIYKSLSFEKKHISYAKTGSNFFLKKINSNHEISLLLFSTAIFNQLFSI